MSIKEAQQLYQSQEYQKVIDVCKTIIKQDKPTLMLYLLVGRSYTKLQEWEKAVKAFQLANGIGATEDIRAWQVCMRCECGCNVIGD